MTLTVDDLQRICAALPATTDERPFGPETAVAKVVGKVFAITPLEGDGVSITLKAQPPYVEALVREHPWITPGYHMNKKHWITVQVGPDADAQLVEDLIVNSYDLVVAGLPRTSRPLS
ncbi:MAG: MmcQ/YjbR family DNA-binding protein [Herbiconiux sp.]|uniref:MmcQ/YjbR family DNA-binding protein n=1 Tax=Herbiconiux sp. TaxID=1871186 RepID=UPI00121F1C7F|nr:MmcQ/YjbR family DNA-binding protein [Herbiconiux sp.]TAJ49421.1 MAG: MmcQ/YjbR family DNA-binding protein [Herbiconiux sp.]